MKLGAVPAMTVRDALMKAGVSVYSVTQVKNGEFLTLRGVPSSNCHNSYSVAKVFTMTAVGMLVDEGRLSTEDRLCDLLALPAEHHPNWERVTVHHLLKHCYGIDLGCLDIDAEDVDTWGTKDYLNYCLTRPLPYEPGTHDQYTDSAYYMLGRIVSHVAGQELASFLRERLFAPLDFKETAWSFCPMGYSMAATGLYISSGDCAKLGCVYLNGGLWNGQRIISEKWVHTVLEREYELHRTKGNAYKKGGMYGQMLYIAPEKDLVLAWHAFDTAGATAKVMESLEM